MATFSDAQYDDKKLQVLTANTTNDLAVLGADNYTTVDYLNGLRVMTTDLRTSLINKDIANKDLINGFMDKLESDLVSYETQVNNQITTLQNSINTALTADITALTSKINALKTFLDDGDATNSFLSMVEYIGTLSAKINEINSKAVKITKIFVNFEQYFANGRFTYTPPANSVALNIEFFDLDWYIKPIPSFTNEFQFQDTRYIFKSLYDFSDIEFTCDGDPTAAVTLATFQNVSDIGGFVTALTGV